MAGRAPRGHRDARALIHDRLAAEQGTLGRGQPAQVCLAYPSPYRVGMSSLGFQTLYRELHASGLPVHRAFLPDDWAPMALPWPQPRQPVLTYEGERPVSDYRVIAMSVAYELELAGVIRFLEGAGIPVLARDRGPRDPILVLGGPLTFSNPYTLLPFADVLILGEAEVELPESLRVLLETADRDGAIRAAAARPHSVAGEIDGPSSGEELPAVAKAPLDRLPAHAAIVTSNTELADMFLVEPERGCSRQCQFCVMRSSTNGGMRILDQDRAIATIPGHAKRVGLVGAAVTDLPDVEGLVARIVESGRGVGISSLRADRLTPTLLDNLLAGGYRQITVASDGISQRMRKILQRRIKEESLLRAAQLVAERGFRGLKVYEMIGAPGETEEDVDELIAFARELSSIVPLTLTFSTFVAKRNTPLDGAPFLGMKEADSRLKKIRRGLQGKVTLRPQSPRWAHVEHYLAQWGAEAGHASLAAVRAGGRYRDWIRALEAMPSRSHPLRYGDEAARARRKGKAAKRGERGLPVVEPGIG